CARRLGSGPYATGASTHVACGTRRLGSRAGWPGPSRTVEPLRRARHPRWLGVSRLLLVLRELARVVEVVDHVDELAVQADRHLGELLEVDLRGHGARDDHQPDHHPAVDGLVVARARGRALTTRVVLAQGELAERVRHAAVLDALGVDREVERIPGLAL